MCWCLKKCWQKPSTHWKRMVGCSFVQGAWVSSSPAVQPSHVLVHGFRNAYYRSVLRTRNIYHSTRPLRKMLHKTTQSKYGNSATWIGVQLVKFRQPSRIKLRTVPEVCRWRGGLLWIQSTILAAPKYLSPLTPADVQVVLLFFGSLTILAGITTFHSHGMDTSSSSTNAGAQIRQKRVLPSRSRRGGPGVGSCDVDLMILDTQKRQCM
jgi:hypothetical protein